MSAFARAAVELAAEFLLRDAARPRSSAPGVAAREEIRRAALPRLMRGLADRVCGRLVGRR
jgi:hypothetical protein